VSSDFSNLLERLVKAGVDFVIVGGFAGVVHGCTYVTQDVDICCDFSAANLLALQNALSDLNPVHRMTPGRKKLQLTRQTIFSPEIHCRAERSRKISPSCKDG